MHKRQQEEKPLLLHTHPQPLAQDTTRGGDDSGGLGELMEEANMVAEYSRDSRKPRRLIVGAGKNAIGIGTWVVVRVVVHQFGRAPELGMQWLDWVARRVGWRDFGGFVELMEARRRAMVVVDQAGEGAMVDGLGHGVEKERG
ncbi:unnamed protein product [Sphenostylis stenocarpa]|uniref:Uncharacterized protein n=1 Tax=Sphenostylis stenocarpa TaxID=92480 RepID=A0AA86TAD8_9FABA|nr:unnamed protein product [Sphenostylis stenocarpa]